MRLRPAPRPRREGAALTAAAAEGLAARVLAGDPAGISRAITLVEDRTPGSEALLARVRAHAGRAHRVGLTGPPGAGKSTLAQGLVRHWRGAGRQVAVVAVDPTSPRSGGALLGDRIRMAGVALDPGVFIRSLATRGAAGGLAGTTREVCDVLDAAGYEMILVETVGVGQTEVAVAAATHTTVLVLVPESGDAIQTLKAGLMELAHLIVVNKADRPGAAELVHELEAALAIRSEATPESETGGTPAWQPPVLATTATTGDGVASLAVAIDRHRAPA